MESLEGLFRNQKSIEYKNHYKNQPFRQRNNAEISLLCAFMSDDI